MREREREMEGEVKRGFTFFLRIFVHAVHFDQSRDCFAPSCTLVVLRAERSTAGVCKDIGVAPVE